MITLFVKTGCPYCAKVLAAVKELELPYTERNISDPQNVEALVEEGGKQQVPFMEDDNKTPFLKDDDVEMYESDAIVAYLREKYGNTEAEKKPISIHITGSGTCSSHL